jgi:ERCC4-type nuclease
MPVSLRVDSREPREITEYFPAAEVQTMDVGDFQITRDETPVVVIERKSWSDLLSSIQSGHLIEQTTRLITFCAEHGSRPVLLVESPKNIGWEGKSGTLSNKFVSCTLHKFSLEGVSLIYTANITHTLQTVLWIKERCERGKIPLFAATLNFENAASSSTQVKKSANCTPESTWQSMLCAVRGISKSKAKTISEQFPSVASMKKTLDKKNKLSLTIKGVGAKTEQLLTAIFFGY